MFDFYKPPVLNRYTAILGPFKIEYIAINITRHVPKVCIVETMIASPEQFTLEARNSCRLMRHYGLFNNGKNIVFGTANSGEALLTVIGH